MAQAWSIEVGACKSETWNSTTAVGMPEKRGRPSPAKERNQKRLSEWSLR